MRDTEINNQSRIHSEWSIFGQLKIQNYFKKTCFKCSTLNNLMVPEYRRDVNILDINDKKSNIQN